MKRPPENARDAERAIEALDQAAYLIRDLREQNAALSKALAEKSKALAMLQKKSPLVRALQFTQRELGRLSSDQFALGRDKPIRDRIQRVLAQVNP